MGGKASFFLSNLTFLLASHKVESWEGCMCLTWKSLEEEYEK